MTRILVTGATGNVGRNLTKKLSALGIDVFAGTRNPSAYAGAGTAVLLDWDNESSVATAFQGVDKVYLLTPVVERHDQLAIRGINAASAAGVKHLVRQSTVGAELQPGFLSGREHRSAEATLQAGGVPYTILRPNLFSDNFATYFRPMADGVIRLSLGTSGTSYVDARDVADAAAAVLTDRKDHSGIIYTLTGPAALTTDEVASQISAASGGQYSYQHLPADTMADGMKGAGLPGWMVTSLVEMYKVMSDGAAAAVTGDVEMLSGHPPRSFATFASDNATAWAPARASS